MSNLLNTFEDREVFAKTMLEKYANPDLSVISDIGAGYGFMQAHVEKLGAIWQPFDYLKKIKQTTIWDLNNLAPKTSQPADMALFLEVLEHLANPLLGLQNIGKHLKKDGVLILTTPNPQSSKNRINLLLKGVLYAFQEKHLKEQHVFTPWEHIVKFFLEQSGFEILEYAVVDTKYQTRKTKGIKEFLKLQLEKLIEKRYPKAQGMSYGIVARKID
ncbi:class I SAM-dependent methyltransferase [Meridianimaribacter flavus]|uniref:Methyltransferase family protein n=1 Tax=Meridianimaribacter flavus TaxID=571115 RepID=A0ABY2G737_9FLAO|nr:methyltransferase domain-containing protein [Meridianimaribacter flavus]TDY11780.1 methyltransferase family protein [Meridianimaribacter flavus]